MTIILTYSARAEEICIRCPLPIKVGQTIHELATGERVHQGCLP